MTTPPRAASRGDSRSSIPRASADAADATRGLGAVLGHRLVTGTEPEGRSPTGRPWMALSIDLPATTAEYDWCIREAERIDRIEGRVAAVWLRCGTVTVYVDRVSGVAPGDKP